MKLLTLVIRGSKQWHQLNAVLARLQERAEPGMSLHGRKMSKVCAGLFKQVKGMEDVANGFAIHNKVGSQCNSGLHERRWNCDQRALTVAATNLQRLAFQNEAATVLFLLHYPIRIFDELKCDGLADLIQQLREMGRALPLVPTSLIGRTVLA